MTEQRAERNGQGIDGSPFKPALEHTPRENARDADDVMDEKAKRRETEQAQNARHEAEREKRGDTLGNVADINSAMTSRD